MQKVLSSENILYPCVVLFFHGLKKKKVGADLSICHKILVIVAHCCNRAELIQAKRAF